MATLDDAERFATALGEVTEGSRYGHRTWFAAGKSFAWERPFSKADIRRFGAETPPDGPILALSVADLADKEAVLAAGAPAVFTISHFDGYPAVLVDLPEIEADALRDLVVDAWLAVAPDRLTEPFLRGE